MQTVLTAERLWDGIHLTCQPVIVIEVGRISSIATRQGAGLPHDAQVLDFPGATLAPAFFDVHIHGGAGHDVMEGTPEALTTISRFLAAHGTGSYLATTVTAPLDSTLRSLAGIAGQIRQAQKEDWPGARPLGLHLEGPFLS